MAALFQSHHICPAVAFLKLVTLDPASRSHLVQRRNDLFSYDSSTDNDAEFLCRALAVLIDRHPKFLNRVIHGFMIMADIDRLCAAVGLFSENGVAFGTISNFRFINNEPAFKAFAHKKAVWLGVVRPGPALSQLLVKARPEKLR